MPSAARTMLWVLLAILCVISGPASAISGLQAGSNAKQSGTQQKMTEQQTNGESLFMQRCSLCHVSRHYKAGPQPTVGPDLSGMFKSATPAQEKALREIILKGGPNMPGYQYAFDAKQMDDVISFLKTL